MAAELGSPNRLAAIMNEPLVDIWPLSLQTAEPIPNPQVLPIRPDQPTTAAEDPPLADIPPLPFERSIYATFGTVFATPELFTAVLAAVRDLPANVIMTTGIRHRSRRSGPGPRPCRRARVRSAAADHGPMCSCRLARRFGHGARGACRPATAGLHSDRCRPARQCCPGGRGRRRYRRPARRADAGTHPGRHRRRARRSPLRHRGRSAPGRDPGHARTSRRTRPTGRDG